jgi:hypothetical protein
MGEGGIGEGWNEGSNSTSFFLLNSLLKSRPFFFSTERVLSSPGGAGGKMSSCNSSPLISNTYAST